MVSERAQLGFCRSVPGTPGNGTVRVFGGRSPFLYIREGTERSLQHWLTLEALAAVVPSSEPAVARSPCPSAASWRATAGDREGIHGAFVGECRSELAVTLQQTESRDYRARERLVYRAHSCRVHFRPTILPSVTSTDKGVFQTPTNSLAARGAQ